MLTGKYPSASSSSPLVFYQNPGPVSFIPYPMVH